MVSDYGMQSMLQRSNNNDDELGYLLREQMRQQEMGDLNIYRSGSAPPSVEGSLNAVGSMLSNSVVNSTEEKVRSDPAYASYYYKNVHRNPRLPPPLLPKEDIPHAQRLLGGGSWASIGDRRRLSTDDGDDGSRSMLSMNSDKAEHGSDEEWHGNGLFGMPGLGLGRQQSIADFVQDDIPHETPALSRPSHPTSHNAFGNNVDHSESHYDPFQQELMSTDALRAGANIQSSGLLSSHSYAAARGASLSTSNTHDPQLVAIASIPRIPNVGGGRVSSLDKRNGNRSNSFNGSFPGVSEPAALAAALSGITLSTNSLVDEENHSRSRIQQEIDDHQNLFQLHGDHNRIKRDPFLNRDNSGQFDLCSISQSAKRSYANGIAVDRNNSSLLADVQAELHRPAMVSANSYLKGPSSPALNGGGRSPSPYQNFEIMNSLYPHHELDGYTTNSPSPPMLGNHLSSGSLPPFYDNAAAAAAMGGSGIDSRMMRSLSLGPNVRAAAAELQNLSRVGNQNAGNALQVLHIDPLYIQYLRSTEYAAQVAALSEQTMDMDLMGLQKAYLGGLPSPQKPQYGLPFLGKSASLGHGYYGNPAFGLGISYSGGLLAGALLPNSPIGLGSPVRNGERSLRFSSGMRNLSGGFMGSWHSGTGGTFVESLASSLLEEFKNNKTKCFELSEIASHVVEFSSDQYGSRFIQQKLETATIEEKNMVFHEIMPHALSLMTDVFGNYVIQKFFEHGTAIQIRELADQLNGHVLALSLQMYGCRVIQKAIEVVGLDQQTKMVTELDGNVTRCVRDQNGNHVIQKCIECVPEDAIQFIISTFYDQVVTLSTHPYGCRVIQRVLEHCSNPKTQQIVMDEIMRAVCMLAQDQYGNYVVQHVLEHGKPHERTCIINKLIGQIVKMSQQKFASNVVEKCLIFGTPEERQGLVNEMLGSTDENEPLQAMMKDQFGNYVVQKVLETCDDQQLELILNRIKVHLNALKKYTYGKHIVARVEKLVAAGERRIGILASYSAAAAAAAAAATTADSAGCAATITTAATTITSVTTDI